MLHGFSSSTNVKFFRSFNSGPFNSLSVFFLRSFFLCLTISLSTQPSLYFPLALNGEFHDNFCYLRSFNHFRKPMLHLRIFFGKMSTLNLYLLYSHCFILVLTLVLTFKRIHFYVVFSFFVYFFVTASRTGHTTVRHQLRIHHFFQIRVFR